MSIRADRRELWAYFSLFVLAALYCNRFYGQDFALEGDAGLNLYFLLHRDLVKVGYDPYQWDYLVSTSINGLFNPILQASYLFLSPLFGKGEELPHALFALMLTSWALLGGVSASFFWFLRKWGLGRAGALLGAVIVSYTGFHLVSVREFDHMYMVSLLAVPPVLDATYRILKGEPKTARAFGILSLWIGFSFLGGTSSPLFYFLSAMPVGAALSFARLRPGWGEGARRLGFLIAAGILGILIAAPVLFPSMQFMAETNRAVMDRFGRGLALRYFVRTIFLRDWWTGLGHYQEYDVFIGLPVLILFLGAISSGVMRRARALPFAGTFLMVSLIVILNGLLPKFVSKALASYFNALSIAGAPRFFIMMLVPIAYFAGKGLEDGNAKPYWRIGGLLVAVQVVFVYFTLRYPTGSLPDLEMAMACSLFFGSLATAVILCRPWFSAGLVRFAPWTVVALVYLMFFFAPMQVTLYTDWYSEQKLAASLPGDRLSFVKLMGFDFDYGKAVANAEGAMLRAPAGLENPATREGRIYVNAPTGMRTGYFSPVTGHSWAFNAANDPATPVRMNEILELKKYEALSLYQVRWILDRIDGRRNFVRGVTPPYSELQYSYRLVPNSAGLPEFFWVPSLETLPNAAAVLGQMKVRSADSYLKSLLVDCSETDCEKYRGLSLKAGGDLPVEISRNFKADRLTAGRVAFDVEAGKPGFLFFGIPFHPAWSVRNAEGSELPILRVNHAFMAIVLDEEPAKLELIFDLRIRRISMGIALAAILFAFGLVLRRDLRKPLPL